MKIIMFLERVLQKEPLFLAFFLAFNNTAISQYIEVDDTYTAQKLVEEVFIGIENLDCIEVFNVQFTNSYDSGGGQMSYGYFNKGASDFQLNEGVLLTTGRAVSAIGPNNSLLSEGPSGNAWPGDQDLEQAIGLGNTHNATALEFDFIASTNSISFDYIFASEQYLTTGTSSQCNYTDGFAFLIKRTNVNEPYTNLAVIPGTNTSVAVNTVRGSGGLCPAVNQQYFESFNSVEHPTNYNGQTKILTAQTEIIAGEMYHIKLVIADQGNNLYDSAVFLMGGSFSNGTKYLGEDRLIASGNPICEGNSLEVDAATSNAANYQWYKDETLIPGATNSTYQITETGIYQVEIEFLTGDCLIKGEIQVQFVENPQVNSVSLVQCESQNGDTAFNLLLSQNLMGPTFEDFDFNYYENLIDAHNDSQNNIPNPQYYISNNPAQLIYVRVTSPFGCYSIAEIALSTSNNSLQNPVDIESCEIGGVAVFDLTENQDEIAVQVPSGVEYQYFESYDDALSGSNEILSLTSYQAESNQVIYVKVSENGNCYAILWFHLIVRKIDTDLSDEEGYLCENEPVVIAAPSGFFDYSWSSGQTSQSITINQEGNYTVTFTNEFGCIASKNFVIHSDSLPEISSVFISDMVLSGNSVQINTSEIGEYQYSLNGLDYQQSNLFENVPSGEYTASVRGVCGEVSQSIFVLDYPKFFTPNGDGVNDYWRIPFLSIQYPTAYINIYDRYGKLITQFRAQETGWDGRFNAEKLPATDYWFVIILPQRVIRGHFSLLR